MDSNQTVSSRSLGSSSSFIHLGILVAHVSFMIDDGLVFYATGRHLTEISRSTQSQLGMDAKPAMTHPRAIDQEAGHADEVFENPSFATKKMLHEHWSRQSIDDPVASIGEIRRYVKGQRHGLPLFWDADHGHSLPGIPLCWPR